MNTTSSPRHVIVGSERRPLPGEAAASPVHPDERIEVTLRLRPKAPLADATLAAVGEEKSPAQRQYLTREQFAEQHGADPADVARVTAFAASNGLTVVESDAARRSVVLTGKAAAMNSFGV